MNTKQMTEDYFINLSYQGYSAVFVDHGEPTDFYHYDGISTSATVGDEYFVLVDTSDADEDTLHELHVLLTEGLGYCHTKRMVNTHILGLLEDASVSLS